MCHGEYGVKVAAVGHVSLKEIVKVRLNGIVVIMFCLHE